MQHMISLRKLTEFLHEHAFKLNAIYTFQQRPLMIECISQETLQSLMLTIPSAYQLTIETKFPWTFELTHVAHPSNDTADTDDLEQLVVQRDIAMASNYTLHNNALQTTTKPSQQIDQQYRDHVLVDTFDTDHTLLVKELIRQVRRLKFCMRGLEYQLILIRQPFVIVLTEEYTIIPYRIQHGASHDLLNVHIALNITQFYTKIQSVVQECSQIHQGIHRVLSTNQQQHIQNIQHILDRRQASMQHSKDILERKRKLERYITQYQDLLQQFNTYYNEKQHDLHLVISHHSENMHQDMKQTRKRQLIEKQLRKMDTTRQELTTNLTELFEQYNHLALNVDQILVDNMIMLDRIFDNFQRLAHFVNAPSSSS